MFCTRRSQTSPSAELHLVFELHSQYTSLNLKRQKALITDVEVASRSFIISELSVIESQKKTIERLMGTYTTSVFAQQSELANFKANMLAILGVIVAITAFVITDLRFQALLKLVIIQHKRILISSKSRTNRSAENYIAPKYAKFALRKCKNRKEHSMSRIAISSQKPSSSSSTMLRYKTNTARAEQLELRMAELDLARAIEIKRPNKQLATAKQKLFSYGRRRD